MTLSEYFLYIKNPLASAKARVVTLPPGESWTELRLFCKERGDLELRLSDIVKESAWLPMPDEVFMRVRDAMTVQEARGKAVVLLGMPGYLALLNDENKRTAIVALREWVDCYSEREAICLLRSDDNTGLLLKGIFDNPRYRLGKQLVEIDEEHVTLHANSEETTRTAGHTEVMLVGEDLSSFIPETCDTFQMYLRYTEEHPNDSSDRRIVVTSKGRELAGLSAEVQQVVSIRDFARLFHRVQDAGLTEDALSWMCAQGKEGAQITLLETLKKLFFTEGEVVKRVLRVFNERKGVECEAVLWLLKHISLKGSYLERVANQEDVLVDNFRSAYVTSAAEWLDESAAYACERRNAIKEADVKMSETDIRQFIARCAGESTSRVAPWLNCGTDVERAELLRRCSFDGFVTNAVKNVYPEVAAYLNANRIFTDKVLEEYFKKYRELKMTGRVTPESCERAQRAVIPTSVQSRDAMVQQYASDNGCALLVIDAMGVEWLPMMVELSQQRNIGVDSIAVCKANLPTATTFNKIHWPDPTRRLPDIKCFDNIVHRGAEEHEARQPEENLAAVLAVIGSEILPRIADGLVRFARVLVTADHGSSRLAMLAWQTEPKLALTLDCESGADITDWRYRRSVAQEKCPPELEETLDGKYWVVRGYNRLPKKGGGQGFELHGGATLEEQLVPVVVFSRKGQFVPNAKTDGKSTQIIEKDDYDL